MKKFQKVLCLFIFEVITAAYSSPFEEPPVQKYVSANEQASLNEHFLNIHNSDQDYTSICWAESIVITENKLTNNKTMSKSYSILLDTPEKLKELHNESENATCLEILEHNSKPKRALNFSTIKDTDEYLIREHKTLFCGAGPVLSHHFIVWPKLNRKQIEISINPLSSTKWRNCNDNSEDDDTLVGAVQTNAESSNVHSNESTRQLEQYPETTQLPSQRREAEKLQSTYNSFSSEEDDIPDDIGPMHGHGTRETKNILLSRSVNCTKDSLGICQEMIEKSSSLLGSGYRNSSGAVIGKWFFLDNNDVRLDRERSFRLKVKIIVDTAIDGGTQGTEMVVEEDCYYVVPKA